MMTREEALGLLKERKRFLEETCDCCWTEEMDMALQALISQRTGTWKEHKNYPDLAYLCSECGYFTTMSRYHYCPNCGARMEWKQYESIR